MKNRDIYQQRAYAARRASRAVDRLIVATQPTDQDRARRPALISDLIAAGGRVRHAAGRAP